MSDPSGKRVVPMRVIVCGTHRTGTASTRAALHMLGFHDCHHMHVVFEDVLDQCPQWINALESNFGDGRPFTREDWDRMLGRCQALCDNPGSTMGVELARVYPEAKVIIQGRDPEKWYESSRQTVFKFGGKPPLSRIVVLSIMGLFNPQVRAFGQFMETFSRLVMQTYMYKSKEGAIQWYNNLYQSFRDGIPEERRIEYKVTDGWKPLCDHLEVPIPTVLDEKTGEMVEAPFPRVNDTASFLETGAAWNAKMAEVARHNAFAFLGRVTFWSALGAGAYMVYRTRLGGRF